MSIRTGTFEIHKDLGVDRFRMENFLITLQKLKLLYEYEVRITVGPTYMRGFFYKREERNGLWVRITAA